MAEKIKIRWKEGVGLMFFLILSGLYLLNNFSISIPGYFASLDFLNFGDEDYWATLLNAFQETILPVPILVGVFLYSLYKTEKNIKEGSAVFVKSLERSIVIALVSVFAWSLLTFFYIDYVSYRSDNVIVPLFTSLYFWMIPIAPVVLAFLFSFIPSLLLRIFYSSPKKFYASVIGFFAFLFLGLFIYQQVSLKNCNFNRDEHCLAGMAIKTNDISFCDKAKSDFQKNICLKVVERKNNKNKIINDWKTYHNEEYGLEVKYPTNIFQLDKNTNTLSHSLKNFHKYSMKDGSDLGLAKDISIVFKKENDKGCNWLEEELDLKSIGVPFEFKNIKGVKYETGAEGEGVVYYCVKNKDNQNIFLIERWFLNASYSTELPKQNDYIDGGKQEEIFEQILSTFKFTK